MRRFNHLMILLLCVLALVGSAVAEDSLTYADLEHIPFYFSSGVGGWYTDLNITADGHFSGHFQDMDMGDSDTDHPYGTMAVCDFTGEFGTPVQLNATTWELPLHTLTVQPTQAERWVEDGILYVAAAPYGLQTAETFVLYLPGTPVADLPEGFMDWARTAMIGRSGDVLPFYGLYNPAEELGFIGESIDEALADDFSSYASDWQLAADTSVQGDIASTVFNTAIASWNESLVEPLLLLASRDAAFETDYCFLCRMVQQDQSTSYAKVYIAQYLSGDCTLTLIDPLVF